MPQRLDSWKEIAAHFGRRVRTVQRWEKEEGMPVHRHAHRRRGTVFAHAAELDGWWASRVAPPVDDRADDPDGALEAPSGEGAPREPEVAERAGGAPAPGLGNGVAGATTDARARRERPRRRRRPPRALQMAGVVLALLAGGLWAARLAQPLTVAGGDPEAVLQARYLLHRGTAEAARRAVAICAGATGAPASDPAGRRGRAAAFECLAHGAFALTRLGELPLAEGIAQATAAAETATRLDPRRAEAVALGAAARLARDWDLPAAEEALRHAVGLDPTAALPHHRLAHVLSVQGRHDEAIAELRAAQRAAPLSAAVNDDGCWFFYRARRHAEAIVEAERALVLEPERPGALECVVDASAARGDHERAREAAVALLASLADPAAAEVAAAPAEEAAQRLGARQLARVEAMARERALPAGPFAYFHARLGHREEALAWLDRARQGREPVLLLVRVHPAFDSLRGDPRLERLLRSAGV